MDRPEKKFYRDPISKCKNCVLKDYLDFTKAVYTPQECDCIYCPICEMLYLCSVCYWTKMLSTNQKDTPYKMIMVNPK